MEHLKDLLKKIKPGIQGIEEYFVSAVLLPIIETEDGLHILFEIRANHLRRQPGEICFPGGAVEKDEICNPQETAVRETIEELGIKNSEIELLGSLNCFFAPPGTIIYPYVGVIKRKESIKPNPAEVEDFFLAPVEYFLKHPPTKSSVEVATRYNDDFPFNKVPPFYKKEWNKRWTFPVYFYEYKEYFIWGITARMLHCFIATYYDINNDG